MTLMSGSVPLGRTKIRPSESSFLLIDAINSFMSLIELCDAASNSIQSNVVSFKIELQFAHWLQGPSSVGLSQQITLARIRASVVFPVPLCPAKI